MSLYTTGTIRVITEPELKQINDTALVTFYGGSSEGKNKNGDYIKNAIDCEVWGNQANTVMDWVGKGGSFQASGQILMDEWEDKQTGKTRTKHKFKISRVELLPRAKEDTPQQAQNDACGLRPPVAASSGVGAGIDDSDMPF